MKKLYTFIATVMMTLSAQGAADPDFYVYLCFGQSNMEGAAEPEEIDKQYVDPRFQTLACVDFQSPQRTKGSWYTAYPPIVRQWTNIGMADYFGRTMVAALPSNVKVGVVDVAIGGVAIDGFMSEKVTDYLKDQPDWMKNSFAAYGNDPYKRLVEMAKVAQQSGVIKGILLHQGESDNGNQEWLQKVKTIYERLLSDLQLKAEEVPLLAGETVNADVGGTCSWHNTVIAQLPSVVPTAHVIPSNGCPCGSDNIHFTVAGYRTMGKRYAYKALRLLGRPTKALDDYAWKENQKKIYQLTSLEPIDDITFRVGGSKMLTVWGVFADGHRENLTHEALFSSSDFALEGNLVKGTEEKEGTVTVTCTDFLGQQQTLTVRVSVSNTGANHVLVANNGKAGANAWDKEVFCKLATPMEQGKTYVVRATMKADQTGQCVLWPRWDASTHRDEWGNSADIQYEASKTLNSSWQELTWTFTAKFPHDVLIFAVGQLGGNVYFDDVSCVEQGSTTERIANGNFESDDVSDWYVLTWTGQSLSVMEDNTTGLPSVTAGSRTAADVCYDLQGRRVSRPGKGLYIINGKLQYQHNENND